MKVESKAKNVNLEVKKEVPSLVSLCESYLKKFNKRKSADVEADATVESKEEAEKVQKERGGEWVDRGKKENEEKEKVRRWSRISGCKGK